MRSELNEMMQELKGGFIKAARGTWKYGYFTPLTAAWFAISRPGSYF